jgi:DNA polymerase elongation subunit (family B)
MGQVTLEGRIFVDSKRIVQQNHKLALYTLSETVQVVMNERPEQFIASHSLLKLLNRDSGDIAHASRALDYALRQAQLPLMLIKHLCTLPDIIELARVTGCLLQEIYGRGSIC